MISSRMTHDTERIQLPDQTNEDGTVIHFTLLPRSEYPKELDGISSCKYLGKVSKEIVTLSITLKTGVTNKDYEVYSCEKLGRCLPTYLCARKALSEKVEKGIIAQSCSICEFRP